MKKIFYLSTALILCGMAQSQASCIQTPSCSSLGYSSSSSCTGGIKCPFGNAWNCTASDLNNKITELEKVIEELQQNSSSDGLSNCQIGDILYSDKTCNPTLLDNKSPIGVVFDNTRNLAIALDTQNFTYAKDSFIVSGVPSYKNQSQAEADFNGKENTQKTLEYCQSKQISCPAFEYVNSYITAGTQVGDWYLPALGELKKIYAVLGTLNRTLAKIGGMELPKKMPIGELDYGHLSSTKYENWGAWGLVFYYGDVVQYQNNYGYLPFVRPVIDYAIW